MTVIDKTSTEVELVCCPTCGHEAQMRNGEIVKAARNPVHPHPVDYGFDKFWAVYPRRNGMPLIGKKVTLARWKKLDLSARIDCYNGARNLAGAVNAGLTIPKDPERFLLHELWNDWLAAAPQDVTPRRPQSVPASAVYDKNLGQWCA